MTSDPNSPHSSPGGEALPPEFDREMTVEEFLAVRLDLPEAGQWAELEAGRVCLRPPPEVAQGDVVGNLMREASAVAGGMTGLPIFRTPVQVAATTVRQPAMSWVSPEVGFGAVDAAVLQAPPRWVVEIAGSRPLRDAMADRVRDWLAFGVELVWVVDPDERRVHRITESGAHEAGNDATLTGDPVVPSLSFSVDDLFREPDSWLGRSTSDDADSADEEEGGEREPRTDEREGDHRSNGAARGS